MSIPDRLEIRVLVGMIGSGKSTYARKLAKDGWVIVSHDDLTEAFHGEYRYEQELRPFYMGAMLAIAMSALKNGRSVVVDRTHLTKESRAVWVNAAKKATRRFSNRERVAVSAVCVTFPIESPEVHAARRCGHDPRGRSYDDWVGVARHHYSQAFEGSPFDPIEEGFSRRIEVGEDGTEKPWPNVHELKCWPEFFQRIWDKKKTFEVRKDDRGYMVGDVLKIREYDPCTKEYSGRHVMAEVSYVMSGAAAFGFGVAKDHAVLSLSSCYNHREAAEPKPEAS
jgi:adenylate kinase family enzyme